MIAKGAQGMIVKRRLPYAIKKARNGGRDHAGAAPSREALTLQKNDGPRSESKESPGRAGASSNPRKEKALEGPEPL